MMGGKKKVFGLGLVLALSCSLGQPVRAGTVSVEPILLEIAAPGAAAILRLKSTETHDVTVQTRVEHWTQIDGTERLDPTSVVVSSPPALKMTPNSDYVVRIVRVSKAPVIGEESYRAIIDQLPANPRSAGTGIHLLIRQSIPVFFRARELRPPLVAWSLSGSGGAQFVTASNSGDERLRIASLRLRDGAGRSVFFGDGLVGYVLGQSSIRFRLPLTSKGFGARGPISVSAMTDRGPLQSSIK